MGNPEGDTPERKKRPTTAVRLLTFMARSAIVFHGDPKKVLLQYLEMLSEDSIIGPRLCRPAQDGEYLEYSQAVQGEWLGYDLRRKEFFPHSADKPGFKQHFEGVIYAYMLDGIAEKPVEERTEMNAVDLFRFENVLALDKPRLETLLELGMLARRSHEAAYEYAGFENHIPELRSRGVANEPVYQVTPKAHGLIALQEAGGKKTPKRESKLERVLAPGRLAW